MAIQEILEAYQGDLIPGWAAMSYYIHHHAGNDALLASFAVVGTHLHREKWGENYEEYLEIQAAEQARADEEGEYDDEYGYDDDEFDEYDFGFGFSDGGGGGSSDEADGRAPRRRSSSSRGGPRRRAPMNRRLPPAKDYEEPW